MLFLFLSSSSSVVRAEPVQFRTVMFYDLQQDCDPIEARFGACIEEVVFFDPQQASSAQMENLALSYAAQWGEIARFWNNSVQISIDGDFPMPSQNWGHFTVGEERSGKMVSEQYSAPLGFTEVKRGQGVLYPYELEFLYPPLRYLGSSNSPKMNLVHGNFVEGLGYDGRPHPYDIMDADRQSSAPFYEQLYPFDPKLMEEDQNSPIKKLEKEIILAPPKLPAIFADQKSVVLEQGLDREIAEASSIYSFFTTNITNLIGRYASEDYTDNHMKILAAVTLMEEPPVELFEEGGENQKLVAASLGQTDQREQREHRMLSNGSDIQVNLHHLPDVVVEDWIEDLTTKLYDRESMPYQFIDTIIESAQLSLKENILPLPSMKDADLWLKTSLLPSADYIAELRRLKQAHVMFLLEEFEKQQSENDNENQDLRSLRIVIDHFSYQLGRELNSKGVALSPNDMAQKTSQMWEDVLNKHGVYPKSFQQSTGRVDPVAICTTEDGTRALSEKSIRPISVDYLLAGPQRLSYGEGAKKNTEEHDETNHTTIEIDIQHAYELLDYHKDELPFVLIDDPSKNKPKIEHIVNLPNDKAIYRVRWTLWSGWHLLWDVKNDEQENATSIQAKTAAFCGNMVFAHDELIPTLLRASLLENLFPTTPVQTSYVANMGVEKLKEQISNLPSQQENIAQFSEIQSMFLDPFQQGTVFLSDVKDLDSEEQNKSSEENTIPQKNMIMVVENDFNSAGGFENMTIQSTPYQSYQHRQNWMRIWTRSLSPTENVLLIPKSTSLQPETSKNPIPLYAKEKSTNLAFEMAYGQMPFVAFSQSTMSHFESEREKSGEEGEIYDRCVIGSNSNECMNWSTLELGVTQTHWLSSLPKQGFDLSARTVIDIYRPKLAWSSIRPHVYISGGWRWQHPPKPLWTTQSKLWGPNHFESGKHLSRYQYGVRGGILIGDGLESRILGLTENGTDLGETLVVEGWSTWSSGKGKGDDMALLPYEPNWFVGPFVQLQLGFDIQDNSVLEQENLSFFDGFGIFLGIRGSWQLQQEIAIPEISVPE